MSILSFNAKPPEIVYGDASFFVSVLFNEDKYHNECICFDKKLEKSGTLVALSPFGLDEIWFASLRLLAIKKLGERGWQHKLKSNPSLVRKYTSQIEQMHDNLLAWPYILVIDVSTQYVLKGMEMMRT